MDRPLRVHHEPQGLDPTAYVAPTAIVLGDVTLGAESSVWFGAVVRGDSEAIRIGRRTNIQDGAILHADPGFPCILGDGVTVGHGAIVHGATVEDDCLIGMRSVVMNGARIGRGSIVGVGCVVPEGMQVPPGSVVLGVPARVHRQVTPQDQQRIAHAATHYVEAAAIYRHESPLRLPPEAEPRAPLPSDPSAT
jgi:carbonic anhydrase/acetyltransferase-like protein (isoleucine patch superfamily)